MKILLLGSDGSIGRKHKENLSILGEHDVLCVDKGLGNDIPDNVKQFDLIIIATPTDTHLQLIHYFNERNCKYIMCEKPVCNLPTVWELPIELRPDYKPLNSDIFVNNAYRFESGMKCLKDNMYLVGKKRHVMMENSYAFEKLHKYPHENYEGILYDDVHIINTSRFIFGEPTKHLYSYITKDICQFAWNVDDLMVSMSTDIVGQRYKKRIEVKGDEGTLIYNFRSHQLWFEDKAENERKGISYKFHDHIFESMKYVLSVVREGKKFEINTIADAVKDIEIIKELTK